MAASVGALIGQALERVLPISVYVRLSHRWLRFRFTEARRKLWYERLEIQLEAGGVADALRKLITVAEDMRQGARADVRIMAMVQRRVIGGDSFEQAMQEWIPPDEHLQISAAELGTRLRAGLSEVIELLEAQEKLKDEVVGVLLYPAVGVLTAVGVIDYIAFFLLPEFRELLAGGPLAPSTRSFFETCDWLLNNTLIVMGGAMAAAAGLMWTLPNLTGPLRIRLDQYLPWSLYRTFVASGFLFSFAGLVASSGEKAALERMKGALTPYLAERVEAFARQVAKGVAVGRAMRLAGFSFPDRYVIEDLMSHEGRGGLSDAIRQSARRFYRRSMKDVLRTAKLVKYGVMFGMVLILAWLFDGIYSIVDSMPRPGS